MKVTVYIPLNIPDSHGDLLPIDFSIRSDTPVRLNFQGESIGRVISSEGDRYTMEVDEFKLPHDTKSVTRLFPGGMMKEDDTFNITECSVTQFSFIDKK